MTEPQEIKPGQTVTIVFPWTPGKVTGIVVSAINYGSEVGPDWYIELCDVSGKALYWKQSIDGGKIQNDR